MNHETTTQEILQKIDPATLCQHCPFAPKNSEGNGQQTEQWKTLPLALEEKGSPQADYSLESAPYASHEGQPESSNTKAFDDLVQQLALAYLMNDVNEAKSELRMVDNPAHEDDLTIKAELERLEQRAEMEEARNIDAMGSLNQDGVATLTHPANDASQNGAVTMPADGMTKSTIHRWSKEQKEMPSKDGQHLAQPPHCEASKDKRGTDREVS